MSWKAILFIYYYYYYYYYANTMSVAVWGIAFAVFLLGLPMLAGANAFNVTSSIATSGLCLAYALPISFRMLLARGSFEPGPFSLGRYVQPKSSHII